MSNRKFNQEEEIYIVLKLKNVQFNEQNQGKNYNFSN